MLEFVLFFGLFIGIGFLVLRICKEGDYEDHDD